VNGCSQGLEEFCAFHFLTHMEKKNNNLIINEPMQTDTRACSICWLEWRVVQGVMDCIEYCMNVNTLIIDEFKTLEKSNSDTS
jgi:hypothetical protein